VSREPTESIDLLTRRLQRLLVDAPIDIGRIGVSKRPLASAIVEHAMDARLDVPTQPSRITFSHPFSHRPLVEFMLAIPGDQLSAPGVTRALMRRAFAPFVPPRILARFSKGNYPPSAARAARLHASSLRPVQRLEVVRRGWVNAEALDRAIGLLVDGGASGTSGVRRVLRLEDWLTSRNRRAPAAIPQRKEVTRDEVLNA
jgi:hypothetical protein